MQQSTRFLITFLLGSLAAFPAPPSVDFSRDVRPILSDNCFQCHGPDEKHRMAGLRLDTKDGAFARTRNGSLIVPGDPAKSLLFERINHAEKARKMPPPMSDRQLTPKQIDVVRRWIEEGAKWQTHWAFTAPHRPELPAVKDTSALRNPIDHFIQARLEREGLVPSGEADRRTLLRRLSFDLTGLPPTLEEVEAFVKDKSPDAYEKQVDRLLASPHYGERMAMDWLDVARYADTHGFHIDSHRDMWPWRDWLIKAFNSNMSFDKFTTLQLAGDLLPDAGVEGKIASGFNRNHMINFEGGAIPEEYLVEYVADRAETTSNAWMGLTMGAPDATRISTIPFRTRSITSSSRSSTTLMRRVWMAARAMRSPCLKLPTPAQEETEKELGRGIKAREAALDAKEVNDAMARWRETLTGKPAPISRDGLSAHYDFDGSLNDISGKYQHGRTVKGDPGFGPGQVSRSVCFDGQTLVTLGQVGELQTQQPFTIAFWLRYGGGKQPMPIFEKIDSDPSRRGWEMWLDEPVLVDIQKRAARVIVRLSSQWPTSAIELRTRDRVTQNEWNHLAVVSDGTGKASGIALYSEWIARWRWMYSETLSPAKYRITRELRIGVKEPEAKAFTGGLDDLRFYRRAISPEEARDTAVNYPIQALLSGVGGKPAKADEDRIRDFFLRYVAPDQIRSTVRRTARSSKAKHEA